MSLRFRLSLIISLLFVSGMVLGVYYQFGMARQRVAQEVDTTARFTQQLLGFAVGLFDSDRVSRDIIILLDRLLTADDSRHLDIALVRERDGKIVSSWNSPSGAQVPDWFASRVTPPPLVLQLPVPGEQAQYLRISTNPAAEIAEVWEESKRFLISLVAVLLALNLILLVIIGRWFRPVGQIVRAIEAVEQGRFDENQVASSLPELKVISHKLHHLTRVLSASQTENARLNQLSLDIQEEERRHLAQELHDEFGQSISAIKAIAFTLSKAGSETDTRIRDGAEQIGQISGEMHRHVRSLMGRLRPAMLDELGLAVALQQMVDDWNHAHEDTFCRLDLDGPLEKLDNSRCIHLYRVVQEALTNVSRHASAAWVSVKLVLDGDRLELVIEDDGRGFDTGNYRAGMGLRGMRERASALGGMLSVSSSAQGTKIVLTGKLE